MSNENKQPDERAACDRYSVLDEAGDALLKAGYHEAYEVVYRLMKEARATAPQAAKGDEQSSSFRDLLRPVIAAKIAMGERDIQHGRFEEMFPKFLQAFDAALATPPQATVKGDEPAAYLVRGLNGYNEDSASAWINRRSAEGVAATLFRSSITPLFERAVVPQAEQRMSDAEDAARYRYLRSRPESVEPDRIDVVHWSALDESANEGEGLRGDALDAAIDAARKGASE